MALAPLDVFRRIKAAHAWHLRRFHALAVETPCRRVLVASRRAPDFSTQAVMEALPLMTLPPAAKVVIDALPLREITRQHAPLNAADHDVENGIDDVAHLQLTRASQMFRGGEQLFDMLPLAVSQV